MGRTARIAAVAAFGGLLLALAVLIAVDDRKARAPRPRPAVEAVEVDPLRAELDRCRSLAPDAEDAACDAAWDDHRRRFLGLAERETGR